MSESMENFHCMPDSECNKRPTLKEHNRKILNERNPAPSEQIDFPRKIKRLAGVACDECGKNMWYEEWSNSITYETAREVQCDCGYKGNMSRKEVMSVWQHTST